MKILIVGSEKKWAIENFYFRYLQELGANVTSFVAHDLFEDYYHQSIFNKLLVRSKLSGIYRKINRRLIELTQSAHFDIIWVFKGMEIYPETLQKLSNQGIKLVNYNCDHPFIHTFRGSGNVNVSNSVGHYQAHFCYSLPVLKKIEIEYKIPCAWLPFAYEPSSFIIPEEKEEILKACFIGNPDKFRAETIQQLNAQGVPMDVYGSNWNRFLNLSPGLNLFPAIYKTDFSSVATRYRLQLNIFRPHNDNSHNMRTFEMPGLGCISLAPDSKEHRLLFKVDKEILLYNDLTEMATISKNILGLPYHDALRLRQASYNRTLLGGYNYEARSKQVFDWLQQIIDGSFQFSSQDLIS